MPAICDSISSKISENLLSSFKKAAEKENLEIHLTPTAKQVLSAKIEYEPVASYSNTILSSLQTKYTVLKPNQPAITTNGIAVKTQQINTNGKCHSLTNGSTSTQLPQPKKTLFPRESVQIGWNNMGRSWGSGCGFHNVGNTCYLNSTLQAFIHVPAIAHWLVSDKEHREKGNCQSAYQMCIICAMSQTLIHTQRQQHAITPSLITNRLHTICKHLTLGRQEDAHEFLRYLVEQMEKSYLFRFKTMPGFKELDQYSKETTPLNQILGGYLRSTVTCLSCKYESITFQHFEEMPLDITRVSTLNEAIAGYFARENLEECGYKCESCKKKVSATKRFSLERAPVVLCIQLKRFNVMGGKLSKQIQISQTLDLRKHLAAQGDPNQSCHYKLVSMVTHLGGSASGGHYTAIGLAPNGNFYHFDDSCVSSVSTENVLRTNAYVLFYELVHMKPKTNGYNGHNGFYQNEHTYSKIASSTSTSPLPRNDTAREGFAKPNLPKMIPISIIRQNGNLKPKENDKAPTPPKVVPSTSKGLAPTIKLNGKREASDGEGERDEVAAKKLKPTLPSLPRLSAQERESTPASMSHTSQQSATPVKPKSLVPYETDDEDEDSTSASNGCSKKSEADRINFCRTSSGVFVETDDTVSPSKQGATVDKTVVTKASLTNGSTSNGQVNGKVQSNGYHVKRNDDTITQLTKLTHCGYGSSEVVSWNNMPTNMNREVDKDQQDERKRQLEDEDDAEMDAGRTKKIKHVNRYHGSQTSNNHAKLPNPFQDHQSLQNQNGSYRNQPNFHNDRQMNGSSYNRNQKSYQNGGGHNRYNNGNSNHGGGKFKGTSFKPRDNSFRDNRQNGKYNNKPRYYDNNRR